MIENISSDIVNRLLRNEIIETDKSMMYQYGFEIFFSSLITFSIAIIIGLVFRCTSAALIYFSTFAILRSVCGGYHANTYFQCNVIYAVITSIVLIFFKYIPLNNFNEFHYISLLFSIVVTAYYAPVQNVNKPLSDMQKQIYRILSMTLVVILSILSCLLKIKFLDSWCILIDMTLFVVSFSMFITNPRRGG